MNTELNFVIVCPTLKVRNLLIEVVGKVGGLYPSARKDTTSAQRAYYPSLTSKVIINTAASFMHEKLGYHSVAVSIEVENPVLAAEAARVILFEGGLNPEIHTHAEPEFPEDFIVFVSAAELAGIVLLFVPSKPDPKILNSLDRPVPWNSN